MEALQAALYNLYNPTALRKSPLLPYLAAERHDPLASTRRALLDAIRGLKPDNHVPPHANAWRVYHILTYRYVEQLTQKEVAAELALSVRQLRRLEHAAVDVLGDVLWREHGLDVATEPPPEAGAAQPGTPTAQIEGAAAHAEELAWLKASLPSEAAAIGDVLGGVLETLAPLATLQGVDVRADVPPDLPPVNGPRATVRQALLNLLSAAVQAMPEGAVEVRGRVAPPNVAIHITATNGTAAAVGEELREKLTMTRQLCDLFGGELRIRPVPSASEGAADSEGAPVAAFAVTLLLPVATPTPVLVIDDNADARHLLERYLEGTRYVFHGTGDPEETLTMAQTVAPRLIVLDVMLPDVDGWELLGRLRAHPGTQDVPVIVHTILPQEQLARALGADAFLRKPVGREALLALLDRTLAQEG